MERRRENNTYHGYLRNLRLRISFLLTSSESPRSIPYNSSVALQIEKFLCWVGLSVEFLIGQLYFEIPIAMVQQVTTWDSHRNVVSDTTVFLTAHNHGLFERFALKALAETFSGALGIFPRLHNIYEWAEERGDFKSMSLSKHAKVFCVCNARTTSTRQSGNGSGWTPAQRIPFSYMWTPLGQQTKVRLEHSVYVLVCGCRCILYFLESLQEPC